MCLKPWQPNFTFPNYNYIFFNFSFPPHSTNSLTKIHIVYTLIGFIIKDLIFYTCDFSIIIFLIFGKVRIKLLSHPKNSKFLSFCFHYQLTNKKLNLSFSFSKLIPYSKKLIYY